MMEKTTRREMEVGKKTQDPELAFSRDDLEEILWRCHEYLERRREELAKSLTPGEALDTWDPYLNGYARGMQAGLEMASDLIISYSEWARRNIYHPDERYPSK